MTATAYSNACATPPPQDLNTFSGRSISCHADIPDQETSDSRATASPSCLTASSAPLHRFSRRHRRLRNNLFIMRHLCNEDGNPHFSRHYQPLPGAVPTSAAVVLRGPFSSRGAVAEAADVGGGVFADWRPCPNPSAVTAAAAPPLARRAAAPIIRQQGNTITLYVQLHLRCHLRVSSALR